MMGSMSLYVNVTSDKIAERWLTVGLSRPCAALDYIAAIVDSCAFPAVTIQSVFLHLYQ